MRCNCLCDECWTLDDGECKYEQYDYKAFRYVAVIPKGDAKILSLEAIVRHYPFDDDYCTLETDSEVLHSVWDILGVKGPKRNADLRSAFDKEFFNTETGLYYSEFAGIRQSGLQTFISTPSINL